MNQEELRVRVRARVHAGVLPRAPADRTLAGRGDGATLCDCCGLPILRHQVQYEAEYMCADGRFERSLVAHLDCHRVWIEQCSAETADFPAAPDVLGRDPHRAE